MAQESAKFGVNIENPTLDYQAVLLRKNGVIFRLNEGIKFKMDDLYVEYASALHRQLFLPVENKITTQEILIIPDGLMALLPFEALVPELATKKIEGQYKKVPY